jgi:hypothetical protein
MEKIQIKDKNIFWLNENLLGKKGTFTSDCQFFPNFNVYCKIKSIEIKNGEILFQVIAYPKNKNLTIGGNMSNLIFEY